MIFRPREDDSTMRKRFEIAGGAWTRFKESESQV